jgi:hypothetical protein
MTRIAVNVCDLTRYPSIIVSILVAPHVGARETCNPQPANLDGDCVILECPEHQGRAIVEILRGKDARAKQYPIHAYSSGPRGGWTVIKHGEKP